MYQLFAVLTGITLAVMISINGNLAAQHGVFLSAVIIHVVGVLFALFLCAFRKEKARLLGHRPKWIYLGGAIGVFTTVFNNFAFEYISTTSIVALGLFGQMVTAFVIDRFGLFGMKKNSFQKESIFGVLCALAGILVMLDSTVTNAVYAVLVSLAAGVSVVLSRTVNARLSEKTGALRGSLVNHLVGLPITVVIALLFTGKGSLNVSGMPLRPWIYMGGMLGVIVVLLCNVAVPKVPAFKLTVLTFVGQIFTGVLLDVAMGDGSLNTSFWGGVIIAAGILQNLIAEYVDTRKAIKTKAYRERIAKIEADYWQALLEKSAPNQTP